MVKILFKIINNKVSFYYISLMLFELLERFEIKIKKTFYIYLRTNYRLFDHKIDLIMNFNIKL